MSLVDFLCAAMHLPPGPSAEDAAPLIDTLSSQVRPRSLQDCLMAKHCCYECHSNISA